MRANNMANHQTLVSDGIDPYLSTPSDISPSQQWAPSVVQEINPDDYVPTGEVIRPLPFSPTMEGTSTNRDIGGSASSRSNSSCDTETMFKSQLSHRNRRCFMSKAIHPLSFPSESISSGTPCSGPASFPEFGSSTLQRDVVHHHRSASSSIDLSEAQEGLELYPFNRVSSPGVHFRCGLCDRLISQRSPWSSHRIVRTGDMPIAGVLSCCHVFHVECLDQTTPKERKNDPPCPLCLKLEEDKESSPDQRVFSKLRNGFTPSGKPFREDGPSKPWTCNHAGDCFEGALQNPNCNPLLSLSRSRFGKSSQVKGSTGRDYSWKLKKSDSFSPRSFIGSSNP